MLTCVLLVGSARAIVLPAGFDDRRIASISRPTALAFTPDDRLLIVSKTGLVRSYQNNMLRSDVLDIQSKVCYGIERGLLGVAVDPAYEDNGFVYLYYTFNKHSDCGFMSETTPVNRVSRFTMRAEGTLDPDSERVLIDNIPSPSGSHNGGDLQFGPDELLYVAVGDGGCDYTGDSGCQELNDASRDPHVLLGKILRIERDGSIPSTNPYQGPGTARCAAAGMTAPGTTCRETWASGLRNPFRMAFDPDSPEPRLFINDVGGTRWEEIDLGAAGADFGWNMREGPCARNSETNCGPPPVGLTNPVYAYNHSTGCSAVTGAAFVPDDIWPTELRDDYLYGDYTCGKIFRLSALPVGGYAATEFASELGSNAVTGMVFGPDTGHGDGPSLYYMVWGTSHAVRRISHTANRDPVADVAATPASGAAPLDVTLSAADSTDPDGDTLTYEWDLGDGTDTQGPGDISHQYPDGVYDAAVTVRDGQGGEDTATVRVDAGNRPPVPEIATSLGTAGFAVGQAIQLQGSAVDPDEGQLAPARLEWTVDRKHDHHTHPYLPPTTGAGATITGPAPEGFNSTRTSSLIVSLTATDARGLSATVTKELQPRLVDLRFDSKPAGARLEVGSGELTTPATLTSWAGWAIPVNAPEQRDTAGRGLVFMSWSDGGTRDHTITTPASAATLTARFTTLYVRPIGATPFVTSLVPAYKACAAPNRVHGPPLDRPSCNPPVLQSGYLTVGTDDANGYPTESTGMLRMDVVVGSLLTAPDEADLRLHFRMTDVRRRPSNADYQGELALDLNLAMTDKDTAAIEGLTAQPGALRATVPCGATKGPAGATCELSTSIHAVAPGLVSEGRRAIWELGKVRVFDGGADNAVATEPNFLFATQGVFVP